MPGGVVRGATEVIVRVGLLEVVKQVGLVVRHPGWSDWWRNGRYVEVVQNPDHSGGRRDQGQKDHLSATSGTFESGNTEASFQKARPR